LTFTEISSALDIFTTFSISACAISRGITAPSGMDAAAFSRRRFGSPLE
jgi:hypothetical protein